MVTMGARGWLELWRDAQLLRAPTRPRGLSAIALTKVLRASQQHIAAGVNLGWEDDSELDFTEFAEAVLRVALAQAPPTRPD